MTPPSVPVPAAGDPALRWLAAGLYAAAIFVQSGLPAVLEAPGVPGADKLLHAAAYGLLAVLVARALSAWPAAGRSPTWIAVAAAALAALYGASDELHQALVPARTSDVGDWLADALGAAAGAGAWRRWSARRGASPTATARVPAGPVKLRPP